MRLGMFWSLHLRFGCESRDGSSWLRKSGNAKLWSQKTGQAYFWFGKSELAKNLSRKSGQESGTSTQVTKIFLSLF